MFFAIDLLIPQHGGKFANAWLAATRGVRYVSKKEIAECDIPKLCDEILKMVLSSSSRPRLRLSLCLASRLVNGAIKIYKRQVELATTDVINFLTTVRTVRFFGSPSADEPSPRSPIPRVRRKRKPKTVLLEEPVPLAAVAAVDELERFVEPQIVIDEAALTRPSLHQVDADRITLREALPSYPHDELALGELGVLEDTEPPIFPGDLLVPQDLPSALSQVALTTPTKRKAKAALETPSKRKAISREVDVPIVEVILPEESEVQMPRQPDDQVLPDIIQPETQRVPEIPQQVVPEIVTQRKGKAPPVNKANIQLKKGRTAPIHRCLSSDNKYFDLREFEDQFPVELIKPTTESLEIYQLITLFMTADQNLADFLSEMRVSHGTRDSLLSSLNLSQSQLVTTRKSLAPPALTMPSATEAQVPEEPLLPHQIVIQADVHVSAVKEVEEVMTPQQPFIETFERIAIPEKTVQPLAESTGISLPRPDTEIAALPPEQTFEIVGPPAAERHIAKKAVTARLTPSEIRKLEARNRQKRIRDIIKDWNTNDQGDINIEDVCYQPVNRFNIALAFNDLLSLHKMGYVKLNNKPNSLELGTIEKGEKILKIK